ncbi:MAG: tryptophan 2,3-dioxygenase [Deltaproteobacteria bacterium]|nr:tryptophan 2,3-dioxygenase [Deltaproteobacteria bacterium]
MSDGPETLPPVLEDPPLTYGSYLKIPELLALQARLSEPPHHDEMLFIVIHQVYELWFKQLLHEVDEAAAAMASDEVLKVHKIFKRVTTIQRLLVTQIGVLETMTPQDFDVFRERLNPASGFQSLQFRELEFLSGLKDERYLAFHAHDESATARLRARLEAPTVWDAFVAMLRRRGLAIPDPAPAPDEPGWDRMVDAIAEIYRHPESRYDLYLTCELLVDYDEQLQLWRFAHVKMVERTIGMKRGTGGSSGAKYLASTLSRRCFPALWDLRSVLGDP